MHRSKPRNYQQNSMVVINYLDQLQAGTFEYAIHHLIDEKLDLSVFYPRYQNTAKEWSGTFKELQEKRAKLKRRIRYQMREHQQLDKSEASNEERKKRTAQTIDTLNQAHDEGAGRQVSFRLADTIAPTYTDWMKYRVDSPEANRYTVTGCHWWSRCLVTSAPTRN